MDHHLATVVPALAAQKGLALEVPANLTPYRTVGFIFFDPSKIVSGFLADALTLPRGFAALNPGYNGRR